MERGIPIDANLIIEVPFDQAGGFRAAQQLLQLEQPPTAVVAANDILAIGALQAANEAGLGVPRDLSIVGVDDIFAASTTTPPLTTIAKPKDENGRQAAQFLVERLCSCGQDQPAPRQHIIDCHLRRRGSTAPPSP